jgi:hypothetical protein
MFARQAIYVEGNIVGRSSNHCCSGNATTPSRFIVIDLHVAVNNMKPFSAAVEKQD